jgi:hypothetical protein
MSVDLRTRIDDAPERLDPTALFAADLDRIVGARPDLVDAMAGLDLRPVAVTVDADTWTLRRGDDGRPRSEPGRADDVQEHWTLTRDEAARLLTDQVTPVGLMTAGDLRLERDRIARVMDWWLVLRSLLDDRPVYSPGGVTVDDDLTRAFTLADDPAEVTRFLETNGFLHLRGVFTEAEMAQVATDMEAAAPTYTDGDGRSWWATLADDSRRVVRMQYFDEHSPTVAALLDDDRMDRIRRLGGGSHVPRWAGNRIEALFKPLGVTQGISDIPWHKDCSLGRHSYSCCGLTVGISVTPGGTTTGQLHALAGSHRALIWPSLMDPTAKHDLVDVPLPTGTGDVTVHLSCTMHRAEPPTSGERKVLYTGFGLPARDPVAAGAAHRQLMETSRERAPLTTSQLPA